MNQRLFVLIALLFLLFSAPAYGSEYYVSGGHGSDTNSGTIKQPWISVAKAAETMRAGDTVFIRAGTYQLSKPIRLRQSGSEKQLITFTAYKDEAVIIDGGAGNCFSLGGISGITFHNLKMTSNSKRVGASIIYMENTQSCSFINCEFSGLPEIVGRENTSMIRCMATGRNGFSQDCVVRNCLFRDSAAPAIRLYDTKGWIIENNEFRDCLQAIGGKDQPHNMVVRRNLIVGGEVAFYFAGQGGCANVSITENVVVGVKRCFLIGGLGTGGKLREGVKFFNNTFVDCETFISGNDDGFTTRQAYFNNIFHSTEAKNISRSADTAGRFLNINKYSKNAIKPANYLMDYNCFSIPSEDTSMWFVNAETRVASLQAWTLAYPQFEKHSLTANPMFVDAARGDYQLQPNSPCVGSGRNGENIGAYPRGDDGTIIGRTGSTR